MVRRKTYLQKLFYDLAAFLKKILGFFYKPFSFKSTDCDTRPSRSQQRVLLLVLHVTCAHQPLKEEKGIQ